MKMKQTFALLSFCLLVFKTYSQPLENWEADKIKVVQANGVQTIMHAEALFEDRWDQLPQAQFWKKIILFIAAVAIGVLGISKMYDAYMVSYCTHLQEQAVEYSSNPTYYITQLDHDECLTRYHIAIDATVK